MDAGASARAAAATVNVVWRAAHVCLERPACCVWLPLELQLEWKPQPCRCTLEWPSPARCIPEQHICSRHQRGWAELSFFWFMPVFMCHCWDAGPELEEAGLHRSNTAAHANGQRSIPRGPRLSICSSVLVIKMLLAIYASALLCVHVSLSNFCFYYWLVKENGKFKL